MKLRRVSERRKTIYSLPLAIDAVSCTLPQKRQRFAQTFRGKVYNLVGVIFAFYCVARVLMVGPSARLQSSFDPSR
jgi:hypothetical protein